MTEPKAYAFTNTGVYYTNDGTNFVINTTANATLSALGNFVLVSSDNVTIGNSTFNNYMNATVWTGVANVAGGGIPGWFPRSTNYTASAGDKIIANTQGGSFNITLPASPSLGTEIAFADASNNWVIHNLSILRNGTTIAGVAQDLICDTQAYFRLLYSGSTWVVESTPGPSPGVGSVLYSGPQSMSANQAAQARANIWVTKKNYIINGGMQVSQENGTTAGTANLYYPVDQWLLGTGLTTGSVSIAQVASPTPGGSPFRIRLTVTGANASPAAGEYLLIFQNIEGNRMADLRFGSATGAKTITTQIGCKSPVAGIIPLTFRNNIGNRSYVGTITIAAGEINQDVVKSVTFVADTSGTWANDNNIGCGLFVSLMMGTTYQTSPGTWTAGNFLGTSGQINLMATNGNVFELFDVGLYEGSVAPPFQLPEFITELALCQRYWEKSYDYATAPGTGTGNGMVETYVTSGIGNFQMMGPRYKVRKRVTGTVSVYSEVTGAAGMFYAVAAASNYAAGVEGQGEAGFSIYNTGGMGSADLVRYHWTCNARM